MLRNVKKIHFIGIGGSGMSGIAELLLNLGYEVSGSDIVNSNIIKRLKKLGAKIKIGHSGKNLPSGTDVVVVSSAILSDNVEVKEAVRRKIPVIPRAEMLSELTRFKYSIAIAGTHGKTTTTSMIALVLKEGGLDPTVVIGGRLKNIKSSARLGLGDYLVAEADESDASFLKLLPTISVITNIDDDHLNFYGNMDNLKNAFVEFLNKTPFYGVSFLCIDDENVREILPLLKRKFFTYGTVKEADFLATNIRDHDFSSSYTLYFKNKRVGEVKLSVPGKHNILNSIAASAVGIELDIPFSKIRKALKSFEGVDRRFEIKGKIDDIIIIDDYGHHPTEIRMVLKTVKEQWPERRIICVFQPHRFSRTLSLSFQFGRSFDGVSYLVLLPIYSAGEKPIPGVSSLLIWENLPRGLRKRYVSNFKEAVNVILKEIQKGDILLTIGAGDVYKIGEMVLKELKKR
ncbi:MAG: UDP-N-acetylmuramate--L-alanine ligase [Caldiserica bacterium]|nr:MAG: UDP-N-acetylmuramate--L-alanine ligase [Caldisericota bacterium]